MRRLLFPLCVMSSAVLSAACGDSGVENYRPAVGGLPVPAATDTPSTDVDPVTGLPPTDTSAEPPEPAQNPIVYAQGQWTNTPVTRKGKPFAHSGQLAFTSTETFMAWVQPTDESYLTESIVVGHTAGQGWVNDRVSGKQAGSFSFPSIVSVGDVVHLVYSGDPDGDQDLFYARREGQSWSTPANLTAAYETQTERGTDFHPVLAAAPNGELAIAYLSQAAEADGTPRGPVNLSVLELDAAGTPKAPPTELFVMAPSNDCDMPTAVYDAKGFLHVAGSCGRNFQADILYAQNSSGTWVTTALAGTQGTDETSPVLASTPTRPWVELLYSSFSDCVDGAGGRCADIFATRITGGVVDFPKALFPQSAPEYHATMTVDAFGTVLVAYYVAAPTGGLNDVFFTSKAENQSEWTPATNVVPGNNKQNNWRPMSMRMNPRSGFPEFVYETMFGADSGSLVHSVWAPTPAPQQPDVH